MGMFDDYLTTGSMFGDNSSSLTPQQFYNPANSSGSFQMPGKVGGLPSGLYDPRFGGSSAISSVAKQKDGNRFMEGWNNIFKDYGDAIGGSMNVLGGLSSIYGVFKNLGLQEDAFEHRKSMDLKNYAAQRQMYQNHLENRWKINSGFMRSRGKDPSSEFGTLSEYTAQRQIPA